MAQKRSRRAFVDSGPFVLDIAWPKDPRTPLSRRFLDTLRGTHRAVTSWLNVLEVAGAVSFNATGNQVEALTRGFATMYGVTVWPADAAVVLAVGDIASYASRRMKLGDALTLWAAEACRPGVSCLVTWNPKDFEGRTRLAVLTPEDFLRGM
jgi:hypothetical protein